MNTEFSKILAYAKSHWQSDTKWQVAEKDYSQILVRALADITKGKTLSKKFVRIAGISGSGKTTQLLPAATEYFKSHKLSPVVVAAREFVKYHPHYEEIKSLHGEAELRQATDEFSTIMLFLVLSELTKQGYDIILDVALVDPSMEQILQQMLNGYAYEQLLLMIAVSPEVARKQLESRGWRHSSETEQEFIRATSAALEFYAGSFPNIPIIIWDTFSKSPVYDGKVKNALPIFKKTSSITDIPLHDEAVLKESKIAYLTML